MKKLLTLLLVIFAAITAYAGNIASGSFSGGGTWSLSDGGVLYIDVATIPDYHVLNFGMIPTENYGVKNRSMWCYIRTCAPWGDYYERIYTIRFSSNVQRIGSYAFAGLVKLGAVSFDARNTDNVVIGSRAFSNCLNLSNFDFSHVREIGDFAFEYAAFTKVTLPAVNTLAVSAFANCYDMFGNPDETTNGIYITSSWMPFDEVNDAESWYVKDHQECLDLFS